MSPEKLILASPQPCLNTARLLLRPFTMADAPTVQKLAGAFEVADTTLQIPHPYLDGMAEQWIAGHRDAWEQRTTAIFAVVLSESRALCGAVGLTLSMPRLAAELGYWIGVPHWGQGICTEAAAELARFCFEDLGLNYIYAHHFVRNPKSGRVMQKLGMRYEGCLPRHVQKWGLPEDLACYGMLRNDWELARLNGAQCG